MKHYLLSIYQPKGSTPPREVLERVMRNVGALMLQIKVFKELIEKVADADNRNDDV